MAERPLHAVALRSAGVLVSGVDESGLHPPYEREGGEANLTVALVGRRRGAEGSAGSPAAEGVADPVERPWGCGSRCPDPAHRCVVRLRRRTGGQGDPRCSGGAESTWQSELT